MSPALAGCGTDAPARPLLYVALGASDAVGVGASDPVREGWVPQLYRRLPPGARLLNLGVSGSTLQRALIDQLPVALDAQPDLVTVWLAVNDYLGGVALADYAGDLDTLLARLTESGRARVYLGNLPDLGRPSPRGESVADWNTAIERAAAAHPGVTLVDLSSDYAQLGTLSDLVSEDGFHPNARGYGLLPEAFWRRMAG
jgi:lysophospholipase L1-like esterase